MVKVSKTDVISACLRMTTEIENNRTRLTIEYKAHYLKNRMFWYQLTKYLGFSLPTLDSCELDYYDSSYVEFLNGRQYERCKLIMGAAKINVGDLVTLSPEDVKTIGL